MFILRCSFLFQSRRWLNRSRLVRFHSIFSRNVDVQSPKQDACTSIVLESNSLLFRVSTIVSSPIHRTGRDRCRSLGNIIFDELVLSGNRIGVVHRNAFNGLKLRKLEFQANPIKTIEANAFTDLANYLEEFVLSTTISSSQLTSTTFLQILSELPNLKRLVLRSFDLSDAFKTAENKSGLSSRKLTQLSLQSCSIKQIDDVGTFVHLFPNVERLDLSENRFEYLNIPLVLALKKLKVLILSKNRIHHLNIHPSISPMASSFHPSNSITELDLSYNGKEHIETDLAEQQRFLV